MKWIITTYHWCKKIFWYTFVGLIITLAIAISLFRLYLPDVKAYREDIAAFASEVLEQDVRIDSMEAKLSGFTPLIIFDDVYLLDTHSKKEIVHFEQARLTIDLFRSLLKMEVVPESFTIVGVDLGIKRKANGTFSIQGLDFDQLGKQIPLTSNEEESDELATWFFKRSKLAIKNSRIILQDEKKRYATKFNKFENVNLYLKNDGDRHQLNGTVTLPRELGRDLEIAFDFSGNILNPAEWYGNFFYKADELNLANLGVKPEFMNASLERGTIDLALWGYWKQGAVTSVTADLKATDINLALGEAAQPFSIQQLSGLVNWYKDDKGWKLNVNKFQYQGKNELWPASSFSVRYISEQKHITAYSSFLRLDDIKQVLIDGNLLDETLHSSLLNLDPSGDLQEVYVGYSFDESNGKYSLASGFNNLTISPWEQFPGIENVTGKVWLDENKGRFELASKQARLQIPNIFRKPFDLTSIHGQIDWHRQGELWHVNSNEIVAISPDISADLGFYAMVPVDGSSPYLDLQVSYKNGNAKQAYKYYPVAIMDKQLVNWLDNAFKSGEVVSGGMIFNGRFKDFPFRKREGTLLADFKTKDVELHYRTGWPGLMINDADLEVTGLGLSISSAKSQLYNSVLSDVEVSIASFDSPVIKANSRLSGQTRDLARFLVESPITPEAKSIVDQSRILGKARGNGMLQLPLTQSAKQHSPLYYEAKVEINNNELNLWQGAVVARKINGDVKITPKGVFSDNLLFETLGGSSRAKLYTSNLNKQQNIKLSMLGEIDTGKLIDHFDLLLLKNIKGKTNWQGSMALGNKDSPGYFQFVSDLTGVELKLPVPFNKDPDSHKPFNVTIQFPEDDKLPVNINYDNKLSAALILNLKDPKQRPIDKGELIFACADEGKKLARVTSQLPEKNELLIHGYLSEFYVDEWLQLINKDVKAQGIGLTSLNIPIKLDMEYLKVITSKEEDKGDTERKDPRKIALFDGDIKMLLVNDMHFGHVRFNLARHEDGLLLKDLLIDAPYMHIEGEGSWFLRDGKHATNLFVLISSGDLGEMLTRLGYAAVMRKGTTKAVIQANWHDTPDNFSMEKLNGTVGAVIDDGVLSDVKPGAGRMLGLFSLSELPRRLLLDFSELKEGFAFKQIVGQIDIQDGDAFSETLKIISPIALITIEGRTGLATRDFDQHVMVAPSVSGTLPAISWLAWGGQVGALAFLLDQMFGDQFDSSVATEYEITGSWDDPQIKKIIKEVPLDAFEEDE